MQFYKIVFFLESIENGVPVLLFLRGIPIVAYLMHAIARWLQNWGLLGLVPLALRSFETLLHCFYIVLFS